MALSKRLRYEILRRDNHTCHYCGATAPDVKLTVDHVTPTALGGSDEPTNLVAACVDCNAGKSSSNPDAPLLETVSDDALRWAAAMKQAAAMQQASASELQTYLDTFDAYWCSWHYGNNNEVPRTPDWATTVERWMNADVSVEELIDAARRALGNDRVKPADTWKYTCGIVWKRLKERQEIAKKLLSNEPEDDECDGPDVYELEYEVSLTQDWRRLAYMSSDLRQLERSITEMCCLIITSPNTLDCYDVFDGGPGFCEAYGFTARELIAGYFEDNAGLWGEGDKRTIWAYLFRLVFNYFEAVNSQCLGLA